GVARNLQAGPDVGNPVTSDEHHLVVQHGAGSRVEQPAGTNRDHMRRRRGESSRLRTRTTGLLRTERHRCSQGCDDQTDDQRRLLAHGMSLSRVVARVAGGINRTGSTEGTNPGNPAIAAIAGWVLLESQGGSMRRRQSGPGAGPEDAAYVRRLRPAYDYFFSVGSRPSFGAPVPDEPRNSF